MAELIIYDYGEHGSRRNPPLLRCPVSARAQEDEGVARLGIWGARGSYRDQGAFGVDQEQEVAGRGDLTVGGPTSSGRLRAGRVTPSRLATGTAVRP